MATSQKKNTGRKTSGKSSAGSTQSNVNRKKKTVDYKIQQEVTVLLSFCAVVLLFLCMINVIGGAFGPAVKGFMLGTFGLLAYVLPIIIFIAISFKISNYGNEIATMKLIAALVLLFMIGLFISLLSGLSMEELFLTEHVFRLLYDYQGGGGVVFGGISYLLCKIFGETGSVFLGILVSIICLVIVTERSFLDKVKSGGKKIYDNAKNISAKDAPEEEEDSFDYVEQRKEERRKKKEQEELRKAKEEDRIEEERILNASRKNTKSAKEPQVDNEFDFHMPVIEPVAKKNKDDIHEIRLVDHTVTDNEKQKVVMALPEKETTDAMTEIKISRSDIAISEKTEELPVLDFSEVKTPMQSPQSSQASEIRVENPMKVTAMQEMKTEPPAEKKVVGTGNVSSDMSHQINSMPQPVTERTHEKNGEFSIASEIKNEPPVQRRRYEKPKISLLKKNEKKGKGDSDMQLKETALLLQQTLKTFGVSVTVTDISQGPSVTRYELQLGEGVKVNKIVNLADDIKLNLAAQDIRIEAPIPGKAAVGIEIPNKETSEVYIRDLIESNEFKAASSDLTFAVGKDISGKTIVADIAKMPHMLVAGATGSGKSVCINTLIMSILYKAHPDDVKLIMIDPKVVELSIYNGIPHLLIPVVTDPRKANAALQWAVAEMTKRYQAFAEFNCRDLKGFNQKLQDLLDKGETSVYTKMPQIVVIVDELADLMMVASKEVEESICRLAQLARAAGIHLIIATQRPSVDVITGLIKANMPSRVAFKVTSGIDSRTILDMVGAEKLLGKGDMLFYPQGYTKPLRVQGAFVSDKEVGDVVEFLKDNGVEGQYDANIEKQIEGFSGGGTSALGEERPGNGDTYDSYFEEACRFVVEKEKASSGMLQRVFKIGFTRAARIVDQMEEAGVVGAEEGTKPRKVLMNSMQLEEFLQARRNS